MSILKKSSILILFILVLDQGLKIWVKTHMILGQEHRLIGDWFVIHFTENNGMAFGMELWGPTGKVILTIFRILAVIGIILYMRKSIHSKAPAGYILCLAAITGGALGNIIDSTFYGVIFDESYFNVATFLPHEGGYSSLFKGRVVDMFYFPVFTGHYPEWFPFWANQQFIFFRPVFNIADIAITTGVLTILVFQRRFFHPSNHSA